MKDKAHRLIPGIVKALCWGYDAWIVGSAVQKMFDGCEAEDWDVIVPFERWNQAAMMITTMENCDVIPTAFGGWKVGDIDIWPDNLEAFLLRCQPKVECAAFHPKSGMLLRRDFCVKN